MREKLKDADTLEHFGSEIQKSVNLRLSRLVINVMSNNGVEQKFSIEERCTICMQDSNLQNLLCVT
jgi:hypothetical protein